MKSVRSSSGKTVMKERQYDNVLLDHVWEKKFETGIFIRHREGLILSVFVDEKTGWKEQNIDPLWKVLMKDVDLGETTSFLDHVYLAFIQRECHTSKDIVDN